MTKYTANDWTNLAAISVDPDLRVAYINIGLDTQEGDVKRTLPVQANLDIDASGNVVGIEILDWPVE